MEIAGKIFEAITGSHLYKLNTPQSDIDIRGVFVTTLENRLTFGQYKEQINDNTNDIIFYEFRRFVELLLKSNPTMIEMLFIPPEQVIYKTVLWEEVIAQKDIFVSKQLRNTFGGYAIQQIKKARGHKKKIVNPVAKERKTVLDYAYILTPLGSITLRQWLYQQRGLGKKQSSYGVSKVNNAENIYYIYFNPDKVDKYRGILNNDETSTEIRLSSIDKEDIMKYNILYYNPSIYSHYCTKYNEYWQWVNHRNPERYKVNQEHGKGYDSKNMMHCFRLLYTGIEIAKTGQYNPVPQEHLRTKLMNIRKGLLEYDDLIAEAEDLLNNLDTKFNNSSLPDIIDINKVNKLIKDLL